MREALNLKFSQNLEMKKTLLETRDAHIIEDNPDENFWSGVPTGSNNMLGILLMDLRKRL